MRAASPAATAYDIADLPEASGTAVRGSRVKAAVLDLIRAAHRPLAARALAGKASIYFHDLPDRQWAAFSACIEHLAGLGYRCVSPRELVAARSDERVLLVSFDDNFRSWHQALGLMARLGVKATFYVNSLPFRDVADETAIARYRRRLRAEEQHETLSRAELREIRSHGHTIGCHSHSHFVLSRLPRELWEREILGSKRLLEEIVGDEISDFSWPYGMRRHFSDELSAYCREIGFKTIANGLSGCQSIAGDDPWDIYRTGWRLDAPLAENLANLRIDGRLYARVTGRSVIG